MAWAPNFTALHALNLERSAVVRERGAHQVRSYGPTEEETLEIVPAAGRGAAVVLFVHGGRWMAQSHNAFIYGAGTFAARGAHFVAARFATLPPQPGAIRMPHMVQQLRRAVQWLHRNASQFGGDPQNIHLVGHSSGAHLASVLLTTRWTDYGLPASVFRTGTCISGMYDLRAVLLSARSSYVQLSAQEEDEFSAIRHIGRLHCPVLVTCGDKESPEFQRHAREFAAAMGAAGHPHSLVRLEDSNHFEGVASLHDPASELSRLLLRHVGLEAARAQPMPGAC
jgi:arylformamidase